MDKSLKIAQVFVREFIGERKCLLNLSGPMAFGKPT